MTRFWLEIQRRDGIDRREVQPLREPKLGIAVGACPGCGAVPFHVQGGGMEPVDADTIRAQGRAACCGDPVGYLYARTPTIFGAEEDRAMLDKDHQRARVYR